MGKMNLICYMSGPVSDPEGGHENGPEGGPENGPEGGNPNKMG